VLRFGAERPSAKLIERNRMRTTRKRCNRQYRQQQAFSSTAGATTMDLVRHFSTAVLASLAVLPHAIATAFWGSSQLAFAAAVVGTMSCLALMARPLAKWAVLPMATILTMQVCPDWICRDGAGIGGFSFGRDALLQSAGFSLALFIAYALIFLAMCLLPIARRNADA
jgi:hypothetical protein